MLALRLIRGARPGLTWCRLGLAAAAGGVGFLLLGTLGSALEQPQETAPALTGLLWTLVPLATTAHLAVTLARNEAGPDRRAGLAAVGLGRGGQRLLATTTSTLPCLAGSGVALLLFLTWREGPWTALGELVGPQQGAEESPLPLPAALALLLLLPAVAAGSCALALRPDRLGAPNPLSHPGASGTGGSGARNSASATRGPEQIERTPATLPWSVALVATGLLVAANATNHGGGLPGEPPDLLTGAGAGVLAGWTLALGGVTLAASGALALVSRLVCAGSPGVLRLLAGRALRADARWIGPPLGLLAAALCGTLTAVRAYGTEPLGPHALVGGGIVLVCAFTGLLVTVASRPAEGRDVRIALSRLGAPASLTGRLAALRTGLLCGTLLTLALAPSWLALLPLHT